jgi:hypothetical protein
VAKKNFHNRKRKTGEDSKSKNERTLERLKEQVERETHGAKSICLNPHCGKQFDQIWKPDHGCYTSYDTCPDCRMAKARDNWSSNEDEVKQITLPYVPHSGGQQLVHASKARFKLINAGSRWGKDRCSVNEYIMRFCEMLSEENRNPNELIPFVYGWIVAPTYKLAGQIWRELLQYFPQELIVNYYKADLQLITVNGGVIEVRTADDPDALVGVGLDIVQITEAARIRYLDEVWANISNRLLSPGRGPGGKGGVALINSTPRGRATFFYKMYRFGQKGDDLYNSRWESWTFKTEDNPYINKEELELQRQQLPERIARQELDAEFLAEGNSVFPYADRCAVYDGDGDVEPGETYTIGWDPAKSIDNSGVAIRNSKGECIKITQLKGKNYTAQLDEIEYYHRYYNYALIEIDKTGNEALPDELEKRGIPHNAVHFTSAEKSIMVNHLALLIEQENICYPDDPILIAELLDYSYTINSKTGNITYGNTGGKSRHDDLVTALMLAFRNYNIAEVVLPYVGMVVGINTNGLRKKKEIKIARAR